MPLPFPAGDDVTLTAEKLRELLRYDPETGVFTWRVNRVCGKGRVRVFAGDVAGSEHCRGYRAISINGRPMLAHRLAWLYVTGAWPCAQVDHKNANRADNRWVNLRAATNAQNARNGTKRSTNKSGFKGVCWYPPTKRWRATITVSAKQISLGYFEAPGEASAAYQAAAKKYFGEFARAA